MTISLDRPMRVGHFVIAALSKQSVMSLGGPAFAQKRPVAVFIRAAGQTRALDLQGREIKTSELERRYPGQRAAFDRAAQSDR